MVHTPVIPDGEIIRVLPLVADLQIVVIDEQSHEPCEESLTLLLSHVVNLGNVMAECEDGLPARDGVGADDGVDGFEELADILGSTALSSEELEAVLLGGLVEARLGVGGGQGVEEFLVWFRDAVVQFVAGGPEGVYDLLSALISGFWGRVRTHHHQSWAAQRV